MGAQGIRTHMSVWLSKRRNDVSAQCIQISSIAITQNDGKQFNTIYVDIDSICIGEKQRRKNEKTLRKSSHLKKINKRHAGNSVQSIQIKDEQKKNSNRRTVSIFIYANKNHSFRSIPIFCKFFLFVLVNLNLNSARCQHRFGRDNRVFEVPRPPPRRVIYSSALVKCATFFFLLSHGTFFHIDDSRGMHGINNNKHAHTHKHSVRTRLPTGECIGMEMALIRGKTVAKYTNYQ